MSANIAVRVAGLLLGAALVVTLIPVPASQTAVAIEAANGRQCRTIVKTIGRGGFGKVQKILSKVVCFGDNGGGGGSPSGQPAPPTRFVACGSGELLPGLGQLVNKSCLSGTKCTQRDPATGRAKRVAPIAQLVEQRGTWTIVDIFCPAASRPVPGTAAIREQALRLLPSVQPRSASEHRALVNIETVLWADTGARRRLPTVTLLGRQVALRLGFDHADWDFGDGRTATTTSPEKPYDRVGDPCDTVQCPDYWGHVYTDAGPMTVQLRVAWTAQFSLDGGRSWTDLPGGTLTGPPATHPITVLQARGELIANPAGD